MIKRASKSQQGNVGLALAIAYFVAAEYTVSIPLNDCQKYDLIVDNGRVQRVQVKTTSQKQKDSFKVELRTTSANTQGYTARPWESESSDLLFVVTDEDTRYVIPCEEFSAKTGIILGKKYDKYVV